MGLYLHNSYTPKAQIGLLHAQLIHNITQSIHNIIQKLEAVQSSSKLLRTGRTSYPFVLDSLVDSMVVLVRASLAAGLLPDLRACEKAIGHIFVLQDYDGELASSICGLSERVGPVRAKDTGMRDS